MLVEVQRSGSPVVVDEVADAFVLQLAQEAEVKAREAERSKLRLAAHWAHRHQVDDVMKAAHWSDADARDVCETIGGDGTPLVHEAAVATFAAAIGVSPRAAMQLMSDALDLEHRLPELDKRVEALQVPVWRARQIARLTHHLSREAAAYVDARVAPVAETAGVARIERLVAQAVARFDPEQQTAVEDEAKAAWDVTLEDYTGPVWAGTSRLEAIGDTPTLKKVYALLNARAHARLDPARPADQQPPLGHRKVAALGDLADGNGASSNTKLYLHLEADTLPDLTEQVGVLEKLGPLTLQTIRDWLQAARFTVQPVLDLARTDAVDGHDPPEWMRELVILRDRTCVGPGCDQDARDCDIDHIDDYVELDDGGPPGQTRPDNLAPLCRRHHRAKTHHGWSYRRNPDGSYTWTDPFGRTYLVSRGAC